jgi:hypothetical protein
MCFEIRLIRRKHCTHHTGVGPTRGTLREYHLEFDTKSHSGSTALGLLLNNSSPRFQASSVLAGGFEKHTQRTRRHPTSSALDFRGTENRQKVEASFRSKTGRSFKARVMMPHLDDCASYNRRHRKHGLLHYLLGCQHQRSPKQRRAVSTYEDTISFRPQEYTTATTHIRDGCY